MFLIGINRLIIMREETNSTLFMTCGIILVFALGFSLTSVDIDAEQQIDYIEGEVHEAGLYFKTYDHKYTDTVYLNVNNTQMKVNYVLTNLMYYHTSTDRDDQFLLGYDHSIDYDETIRAINNEAGTVIDTRAFVHQCPSRDSHVDHWVYLDLAEIQNATGTNDITINANANHKTYEIKTHIKYGTDAMDGSVRCPQNTSQMWFENTENCIMPDNITIIADGITLVKGTDYQFRESIYGPLIWLSGQKHDQYEIYATFEKIKHTISFNVNGGSIQINDVTVDQGSKYVIPDYKGVMEGHVFNGWSMNNQSYVAGDTIEISTEDIVLSALWQNEETEREDNSEMPIIIAGIVISVVAILIGIIAIIRTR